MDRSLWDLGRPRHPQRSGRRQHGPRIRSRWHGDREPGSTRLTHDRDLRHHEQSGGKSLPVLTGGTVLIEREHSQGGGLRSQPGGALDQLLETVSPGTGHLGGDPQPPDRLAVGRGEEDCGPKAGGAGTDEIEGICLDGDRSNRGTASKGLADLIESRSWDQHAREHTGEPDPTRRAASCPPPPFRRSSIRGPRAAPSARSGSHREPP